MDEGGGGGELGGVHGGVGVDEKGAVEGKGLIGGLVSRCAIAT